jgi:uncharacterized protein (TIGR02145 family)
MERGTTSGTRTGIWGKLKLVPYLSYWKLFLIRVAEGLGIVRNSDISRDLFKLYWSWGIIQRNELKICILPEAGRLENVVSGVPFISKLYNLIAKNEVVQGTALNQPFLGGNIAPTERLSIINTPSGSRWMVHTSINFSDGEPWSITVVFNWSHARDWQALCLNSSTTYSGLFLNYNDTNSLNFRNNVGGFYQLTNKLYGYIGKRVVLHVISKDKITKCYINGNYISEITANTSFNPNAIFGKGISAKLLEYSVRAGASTLMQIKEETDLLCNYFQETPSVAIGSQVWSTSNLDVACTIQGNAIANMTDNTNVEKIVNGGFDTDTTWVKETGWTINLSTGQADCNLAYMSLAIRQSITPSEGKWYKVIFTISNYVSGSLAARVGGIIDTITASSNGTHIRYVKCGSSTTFGIQTINGFVGSVDDVSFLLCGWSDSQNLYDYIYANTTGTVEQKTYAAVKVSAMWCYYNNDASVGAVYGKLYNWYAAKLIQMDIDYYNAANPSTPWGWRIPTQDDFTTLQAALGGSSVSGGKMKKEGLVYWNTPNTGANNESGFSAIGGGYRSHSDGAFIYMKERCYFFDLNNKYWATRNDTLGFSYSIWDKSAGFSIRLIKS